MVVFGNVGGHGFGGVDVDVVVGYVQVVFEKLDIIAAPRISQLRRAPL